MNLSFFSRSRLSLLSCFLGTAFVLPAFAETFSYRLVLEPAERDRVNLPVTAEIPLPDMDRAQEFVAELKEAGDSTRSVQIEIDSSGADRIARAHWIEPSVRRGASPEFTLNLRSVESASAPASSFRFVYSAEYQDLFFGERPIYRYMTVYDPERHEDTHKPHQQVYGFHGEGFITKGPGGQFQHHKGIYLGWNRTRVKGSSYDFWHAPKEHQRHGKFLPEREVTGPVFARSASTTYWQMPSGETAVRDTRGVTTWKLADDQLLFDYVITIESLAGEVELGGDAHHAGFQFRASQDLVERAEETLIVSPPQAERDRNDLWSNASWMAMGFEIDGNPYTVLHMSHPDNPGPTTYSTRNYGRFGAFFVTRVSQGEPLVLKYRILVQNVQNQETASSSVFAARYADYVEPVSVRVERR